MSYCDGVTDRGMEYLSSLEELSDLELRGLRNITATGLTKLAAGCRRLAELDLKNCEEIDDSGFWALAYYSRNLQQVLIIQFLHGIFMYDSSQIQIGNIRIKSFSS